MFRYENKYVCSKTKNSYKNNSVMKLTVNTFNLSENFGVNTMPNVLYYHSICIGDNHGEQNDASYKCSGDAVIGCIDLSRDTACIYNLIS
jgi:hypothetical protein